QTVALHTPCTQIGASGRVSAAKALLARIPGLDLADLPDRTGCCGAAGLHLLRQSGMGGRLIADKIGALEAMNVKTLLTTNVGCAMHFRRALHAKGLAVSVMHPVSLLCRQLANAAHAENNQ
ncbi:MAG: (Fe-S)-binding protein, partial [Gammaproteobacteria bacterium]|nr:(Fe-S)-binding protein [Gammaproteobacteria bacterium]